MHKSTALFLVLLFALTALLGWNYFAQPFARSAVEVTASPLPSLGPEPSLPTGYQTWLETASTREKVAQIIAYPVTVSSRTNWASVSAEIADIQPGIVTWFGSSVSVASVSAARAQVVAQYPLSIQQPLFAVDHEGGSVQRLAGSGFTRIPSWREVCQMTASESAEVTGQVASELQGAQVDIVFGPVLDLASSSAVLRTRICSGDPAVVLERASSTAGILAQAGILPVFKHFPGIGTVTRDLHVAFDRTAVDPASARLYRDVLQNFPAAGVMVAHVGVLNQYPDIPCSLSSSCIDQLRGNYPEVLIFSDALEMVAAGYQPVGAALPLSEVARRAVEAGNHVLVFGPETTLEELRAVVDALTIAYDTNLTVRQQVDEALQQQAVLRAKKERL